MTTQRVAVYIDGFNLYHGMHDKFGRRYLWLDLRALAGSFLTGGQHLATVKFFTARRRNDPRGQANQAVYLGALRGMGGVEVVEGRFQSKSRSCMRCGHTYALYEEKESDVSLACALVEDAARGAFDRAILVSADSDLAPAVRAARRLAPAGRFVAAFPPARMSVDLRNQMHGTFHIGADKLRRSQFPASVTDSQGVVHTRPGYWQ